MKKTAVVVDCPIDTTINILKGKCKASIILKIREGVTRFGLLKKEIAIGDKLLAIQLKELEEDCIILKEKQNNNPLQTTYSLTTDGIDLCEVVLQMRKWGNGYKLFNRTV